MSSTKQSAAAQDIENPLDPSPEHQERIRVRVYHLWEADGYPEGRDAEYWERARELDAISSSPGAGQMSVDQPEVVDEAELQDNLGEFPGRTADQGEQVVTPMTKRQARTSRRK